MRVYLQMFMSALRSDLGAIVESEKSTMFLHEAREVTYFESSTSWMHDRGEVAGQPTKLDVDFFRSPQPKAANIILSLARTLRTRFCQPA